MGFLANIFLFKSLPKYGASNNFALLLLNEAFLGQNVEGEHVKTIKFDESTFPLPWAHHFHSAEKIIPHLQQLAQKLHSNKPLFLPCLLETDIALVLNSLVGRVQCRVCTFPAISQLPLHFIILGRRGAGKGRGRVCGIYIKGGSKQRDGVEVTEPGQHCKLQSFVGFLEEGSHTYDAIWYTNCKGQW